MLSGMPICQCRGFVLATPLWNKETWVIDGRQVKGEFKGLSAAGNGVNGLSQPDPPVRR